MKSAKKTLSLILICAMMLALVMIPVQAADTVTIYVDITGSGWSNVNVYTWNESGECTGSWPGAAMTHVSGYVYSLPIPADAKNIIFNDGSTQTADLTIPTDGKNMYIYASGLWGTHQSQCVHNWIDGICRSCGTACGHKWSNGTCMVCNLSCSHRNWVDGACVDCSLTCSHSFVNDYCTICGLADPDKEILENVNTPEAANAAMEACQKGMDTVGKLFEEGEYFVGDLIYAGELMTDAVEVLKPFLAGSESGGSKTRMILCTVKDDLHDIGKNIVRSMLEANGFEVLDLGIDVPAAAIVEKAKAENLKIVALSGVLTLALDSMKATVEAFKAAGLEDVKIIIGGAPVSAEACKNVGADEWAHSPQKTVATCKAWAEA